MPLTPTTVETFRRRGAELLESGSPLGAYDALAEGVRLYPADARVRQLLALALARSGATQTAAALLHALVAEGHADEETLGMLARTHKDLWAGTDDPVERRRHLEVAHQSYRDAYRLTGGFWSGINAATMALLLGRRDEAAAVAREVRDLCLRARATAAGGDVYWVVATLGEAALILGAWAEAESYYAEAARIGAGRLGDLASTRRNARLILNAVGAAPARIEEALRLPRVVAFVGHLIDAPGRESPRFPSELEAAVSAAIGERLAALDAGIGFASAACGGDLLFHEHLLAAHGEAHVVLPYDRDQFMQDSVDVVPGAGWAERYARVLEAAKEVVTASDRRMAGGALSYEYAFRLFDGMAGVRADELDTEVVAMAVWDGRSGDGPGGTATSIARWRERGGRLEIIRLDEILARAPIAVASGASAARPPTPRSPSSASSPPGAASPFESQIVALLFADARGFSALHEDQIPAFVQEFLGAVAAQAARSPQAPLLVNTWGDGLYFVFRDVADAGRFGLDLCDAIAATDWGAHGLPKELTLRIGLHAGPAYSCTDPVTGRANFFGAHVSRAARIEPITPPGQVYASRAFAALARADGVGDFRCEYVGLMPLAKDYGTFPMYVVRRRRQ